jgi:DNA-binding Lrp family transcriptional regulator
LLARLQRNLPLVANPFSALAGELGLDEDQVLELIAAMKRKGLVRQIGPVMDARRLGYQSTLVAAIINAPHLQKAEGVLSEHPRVSHAYLRDDTVNLWFTLSSRGDLDIGEDVRSIGETTGADHIFSLPALKLFKIGAFFGTDGGGEDATVMAGREMPQRVELSDEQRRAVNAFQCDLPLEPSPFGAMSRDAEMSVDEFLSNCQSLIDCGVIRRFGASVNHRRAGYEGNGMACWDVPEESVESVGRSLAGIHEVSHCYERRKNSMWRHNVFAMFHGSTSDACGVTIKKAAESIGLSDYKVLFSTREIRKTRVKYAA